MENPAEEITAIVHKLTATDSPDVQKATIETYMLPTVSFRHPVCSVPAGPNSRYQLLGTYQWYRVLSPHIDINVESVVFDSATNLLYLEAVQWFKLFFLPISPAPARLVIRLQLVHIDGLYYIAEQEDFYHPDDFGALLLPISAPFIRFGLTTAGVVSNVSVRLANLFGYWRPGGTHEQDAGGQQQSAAPSEAGLYDKED
ncbi:hypothetical protein D9619_008726 [Psilocybe cf. subviscida]|uniref:SigF-like NTF2-like domain-containing protein n=1 Tax=Psilocybe cf. subviscida TaxID=2480587 RepID=A0A8H5F0I6_9AGAR|nr:hypothetical protein D9619_008726 [Psilocybe cf. subviscida]